MSFALRTIIVKKIPLMLVGRGMLLCVCVLFLKKKTLKQLLTMDTSVPKSIKTAAKCDISCELQNSVNH